MRLNEFEYAQLMLRRAVSPLEGPRGQGASAVPEKTFMAQLIQVARLHGWITYHTFDSRKSPEGFPDLTVARPEPGRGDVYLWELKTARGKMTMAQQLWLTALDGKRITAGLVRPADFADLAHLLQRG